MAQGEALYDENCAACHGADMVSGQFAPALKGPGFLAKWGEVPVAELFDSLRANAQAAADAKGLRLRLRPGRHAVKSDPVLLGREIRKTVLYGFKAAFVPAGGGCRPTTTSAWSPARCP